MKILIVEDHPDIVEIVEFNLRKEGFDVVKASDGEQGLKAATSERPDLVLLDLMLPKMDGIEVCRLLRSRPQTRDIPVIMLTAKGEEADIVRGLELGADDYIPKPFSPAELVARIRAVLRRASRNTAEAAEVLRAEGVEIDPSRFDVRVKGESVKVTPTEFRLLSALAGNPGRVFTRDRLIDAVGGPGVVIIDRNIDVHISSLRKKLGEYGTSIQTVHGIGYRFKE